MKFQSKKKPQEFTAKFHFPDSDEKSGVELRFISDEMRRDAYKELVVEEVDFAIHPQSKRLTKVVTPVFKNKDLENWIIDHLIVSWWGIMLDDKPLDCTKENKIALYREQEEFRAFVDESEAALKESAIASFGSTSEIKN